MSDKCIIHIENYWKTLTETANDYYNKGDFKNAMTSYKDALYRAEVLNNYLPECLRLNIPFMQVFIISCNNIRNTYCELGQREEATKMLKRVVYYLLHLAGKEQTNKDEIRNELNRSTLEILNFAEKKAGEMSGEELLKQIKEQLDNIAKKID